jgi:hypothetical protein
VYGEKKALAWRQDEPEILTVTSPFAPAETWRRGAAYTAAASAAAARATHLPSAHPEGLHEAFANNYRNFCDTIRAKAAKRKPTALELDFPGVLDGVRGMKFINAVCDSSEQGNVWKKV